MNDEDVTGDIQKNVASFVKITRTWQRGDKINVSYPMELTLEECPDYTDYIAFNYGPVLLAAQTTSSDPMTAIMRSF